MSLHFSHSSRFLLLGWLLSLSALTVVLVGCDTGGLTGEIASPACETPLGVVDLDEEHVSVAGTPRSRIEAPGAFSVAVTWADGVTSSGMFQAMSAEARSREVRVLEGPTCEPYYRAPVSIQVELMELSAPVTFEGDADLFAAHSVLRAETFVSRLPGFDASRFTDSFDPEQARVLIQLEVRDGALSGVMELEPGLDGAELVAVSSW